MLIPMDIAPIAAATSREDHANPTRSLANDPSFKQDLDRELLLTRVEAVVNNVVDQFIATAFIYPILQQAQQSPFKTPRFDGGFTGDVFQRELNVHLADEIATSSNLDVSNVLTDRLMIWVNDQNNSKLLETVQHRGFDAIG